MTLSSQEELGSIIQFHRKESRMSRIALAEMAGIGKTAVFDLEKGEKNVRIQTLLAVFNVLNISMELESPLMTRCHEMIDGTKQ